MTWPTLTERYEALRALWRDPGSDDPDWDRHGVFDPDAGVCPNHHYSLSHAMLAAGLLAESTGDPRYGRDRDAMATLLARHYAGEYAPYDPDTVHWDFNNLAWTNCAILPSAAHVRDLLRHASTKGRIRENGTFAGNWLEMRATSAQLRRRLGVRHFALRRLPEPLLRRRLNQPDGGIDEFPGRSRPVQYHAYILALRLRRIVTTGVASPREIEALARGLEFLLAHFDAAGNANYRGRGQYQLFFEGCTRYALEVFASWARGTTWDSWCRSALDAMDRQDWPVRDDGLLALVRTDEATEATGSHYDYHFVAVYNAFDLAWRLLGHADASTMATRTSPRIREPRREVHDFLDSGILFMSVGGWRLALTAGEDLYLSDVGATVCHLGDAHGYLFSAPGGPHPTRYGKRHGNDHLRENLFGPIAHDGAGTGVPHFHRGSMERTPEGVRVTVDGDGARVERRVDVRGRSLHFEDQLVSPSAWTTRHVFHWAVPASLELTATPDGSWQVRASDGTIRAHLAFDGDTPTVERGDVFRTPGGLVRPCYVTARAPHERIGYRLELA